MTRLMAHSAINIITCCGRKTFAHAFIVAAKHLTLNDGSTHRYIYTTYIYIYAPTRKNEGAVLVRCVLWVTIYLRGFPLFWCKYLRPNDATRLTHIYVVVFNACYACMYMQCLRGWGCWSVVIEDTLSMPAVAKWRQPLNMIGWSAANKGVGNTCVIDHEFMRGSFLGDLMIICIANFKGVKYAYMYTSKIEMSRLFDSTTLDKLTLYQLESILKKEIVFELTR